MAASGSGEHPWRRGGRSHADLDDDEPEEGEVDAGSHSETDTEEYYNRCESLSDETITDDGGETATSSAAVVVVPAHDGNSFSSRYPSSSVARGWGGTGRRGWSGSAARAAAVSPIPEPEKPVPTVAAVREVVVLQPMPLAFAAPRSPSPVPMASARASPSGQSGRDAQPAHGDAMVVTAAANDPPTQAVVHQKPTASPAPALAAAGEEEHDALVHQAPPVAGAGQENPKKAYTCKMCGMVFWKPQALGGHVVGHKNRDLAAVAMADGAVVPGGCRGPKPERPHVCNECGAEFRTGVQLGGHKRKHYTGAPIVPKKKPRVVVLVQPLLPLPAEAVADLALAPPANAVEAAQPAVERIPEPAQRPPPVGRVLLFGIDIGTGKQTPKAQQGSRETETSPSSGGEKQ